MVPEKNRLKDFVFELSTYSIWTFYIMKYTYHVGLIWYTNWSFYKSDVLYTFLWKTTSNRIQENNYDILHLNMITRCTVQK